MPTWLVILIVVLGLLVVVLAVGGAIVISRRRQREEPLFAEQVEEANRALAAAHAQDNGWDPGGLDAAARGAFAEHHPDLEIEELTLAQVVDRPGKEEDRAVFHILAGGREHLLTLGRREDGWVGEELRGVATAARPQPPPR